VLDAQWVSNGQRIIALLADGEWGIWNYTYALRTSATQPYANSEFAIHGFIQEAEQVGKLSPRGGMSVQQTMTGSGEIEESVIAWYNKKIYAIPSSQKAWARATQLGEENDIRLQTSPIKGFDLCGEALTSVAQLSATRFVITAEHKLLFLSSKSSTPTIDPQPKFSPFNSTLLDPIEDQRLLTTGALDITGLERMLDSMMSVREKTQQHTWNSNGSRSGSPLPSSNRAPIDSGSF
jgi:hypothetical protein